MGTGPRAENLGVRFSYRAESFRAQRSGLGVKGVWCGV